MVNGYLRPACGPDAYRWAIDRLVEEFGESAVRVGWENDYGCTAKIAVSSDGWDKSIGILALKDGRSGFDLNREPEALDRFITEARPLFRGFGV